MQYRMYSKEQVLRAFEAALCSLDKPDTPTVEQTHLENNISQQSSPGTKMTVTVREAAEMIGISKPKMYELIRENVLPSIHVGKKIVIPRHALHEWLLEGEQ